MGYRPIDDGCEQPKQTPGKSKGDLRQLSINSRKRLVQLEFDPIQRQIELFDRIERKILELESQPRYSMVAYAQLIATKQKIANDLMRYGYSRMPETNEIKNINTAPVKIMLTDNKTFKEINPTIDEDSNEE